MGFIIFILKLKKFIIVYMTEGVVVIAVSQFVKEHIIKIIGLIPKIVLIHHGVDYKEFSKGGKVNEGMY